MNDKIRGIQPVSVLAYNLEKTNKIELKVGMIFFDKKETKCKIVGINEEDQRVGIQYFDHRKKEYKNKVYWWNETAVKYRVSQVAKNTPLYKALND